MSTPILGATPLQMDELYKRNATMYGEGVNPFQPIETNGGIGGGFGGGSATEGLGQIDKGSQTVGTALQKAQQANQQSAEAIGGGGGIGGGLGGIARQVKMFGMKKGGKVKAYAKGGMVSSSSKPSTASSRGDGIAQRGKTRGRMC